MGFETLISECCDELDELVLVKIDKGQCTFTVKWIYFFPSCNHKAITHSAYTPSSIKFYVKLERICGKISHEQASFNAGGKANLHCTYGYFKLKAKAIMKV